MWTNSLLKKNAQDSLKNYYWLAFAVTLVASFLGSLGSGGGGFSSGYSNAMSDSESSSMDVETAFMFLIILLVVLVISFAISFCIMAFLTGPIRCGHCKFYVEARNGNANFGNLFYNFKSGNYMSTVKTMFFMQLYLFLWTMLFYIPGIYKSYEYFLIPYLVAENPKLPKERAFEISKKTMDGEKMNLFILQLSFIGWFLLGFVACCVGIYFVNPYYQATLAEFYVCMRAKMISYGYTTEEELSGSFGGFGGGFGGGSGNPYDTDPYSSNTSYSSYSTPPVNSYNPSPTPNPYDGNMPDVGSSSPDMTNSPNPYDNDPYHT